VPVSHPLDSGGYSLNHSPVLNLNNPSPWAMHHISLEKAVALDISNPKRLRWLNSHVALQMSDRQKMLQARSIKENNVAGDVLMCVKESIYAMMMFFIGEEGERTFAFGLNNPDDGGVYAIILVDKLRLDQAAYTVVLDAVVVPLSTELMPQIEQGITTLVGSNGQRLRHIVTHSDEVTAWKRLMPSFVERCRTWSHGSNCEYVHHGAIPLSEKIDEVPICSCGRNVNIPAGLGKLEACKRLLPYSTRVAISPMFSVSYVESVAGEAKSLFNESRRHGNEASFSSLGDRTVTTHYSGEMLLGRCLGCGGIGKPRLLNCSRCKKAQYCSSECQRKDWKKHKPSCATAGGIAAGQ
jgi:hypothetical protein